MVNLLWMPLAVCRDKHHQHGPILLWGVVLCDVCSLYIFGWRLSFLRLEQPVASVWKHCDTLWINYGSVLFHDDFAVIEISILLEMGSIYDWIRSTDDLPPEMRLYGCFVLYPPYWRSLACFDDMEGNHWMGMLWCSSVTADYGQ